MPVQKIKTPGGEEMALLPLAEYEALLEAANDAAEDALDIAAYDAAKAAPDGMEQLPFEVSQNLLGGMSLLEALRKWRGMTQMQLALKSGISQGHISDLENNRRTTTDDIAARLARALEIPERWMP